MRLKLTAIVVVFVFAAGAPPTLVSAHAEPDSSTPPIGGTVAETPTEVEVVFTQEVVRQGTESSITVTDPLGADVTTGPSEVDDVDRHVIRVGLQPGLANGTYTVGWRTLSATDGDPSAGSFIFTVAAAEATPSASVTEPPGAEATEEETPEPTEAETTPTATPQVDSAQAEDDDDDDFPIWVIVVAVVGLIIVAGVGAGAFIFVRNG